MDFDFDETGKVVGDLKGAFSEVFCCDSLPETNSSPLKINGSKRNFLLG